MVAPRKIKKVFCTVVRVPVTEDRSRRQDDRFSARPSDLLPWADPHIARLVKRLQDEIRQQRRSASRMISELDPPSPVTDSDSDWLEETRWTLCDDAYSDFNEW